MKEMKAAVFKNIEDIQVETRPIPVCPPDGLLVKVHFCGICGSAVSYTHLDVYKRQQINLANNSLRLGVAAAECINHNGDENDNALRHILPVSVDTQQIQRIGDDAHEQNADQCARNRAAAAGKARATDDDAGDYIKLLSLIHI